MSNATNTARPLCQLLPAVQGTRSPPPPSPVKTRPARTSVAAACSACRERKSKCSGERPTCARCQQRDLVCRYSTDSTETHSQALKRKYDEVQSQVSAHEELFTLLKVLPDRDAQDVFRRIRSGADVATILRHVTSGELLLQLALTPETRMRYEFPYVSEMPASLLSNNPYLDSLIYEAASLYSNPAQKPATSSKDLEKFGSAEIRSPYLKPLHAADVVDPLLSSVRPSMWTAVSTDDVLMRDLLSAYFRLEYSFHTPFQKDYFLEDMAAHRSAFCSPLLVNAVLAYACSCLSRLQDRAEYWNPQTLSYRFLTEAKRLWEVEAEHARITTIQAGVVLNMVHNMCSLDKIGRAYSVQAIALAHELRLFDNTVEVRSKRIGDGRTFTAWMLYNFETLIAYHFMHSPMLKNPPASGTLPDPLENARWYGEVWLKYPLTQTLSPTYFGHIFRERCNARVIMNEFCQESFGDGASMTIDQANAFHSRLETWHANLPECLKPRSIVHPGHFQLHIHYQNLIMTLYEPFASDDINQAPSPRQIFSDARRYFETLLRIYYLRHGYGTTDVFLCQPLALTGFMCLSAINDTMPDNELKSMRSTLFLVAKGLHDQSRSHYIADTLFRVIQGQMRPEEATLMASIASIANDRGHKENQMQAVHSQWPVSIITKSDDLEANRLSELVERFVNSSLSK